MEQKLLYIFQTTTGGSVYVYGHLAWTFLKQLLIMGIKIINGTNYSRIFLVIHNTQSRTYICGHNMVVILLL